MKQLLEIKKITYIYTSDLKSFISNIKSGDYEDATNNNIILNTEKLYNLLDNSTNKLNKNKQIEHLKHATELANKILTELKNLKCKDEFIFEKADLIVEIFSIKEKLEKIIDLT